MTTFRDRLTFDSERGEHRDGGIRYLMMRPDALMGMFAALPPGQRLTVLEALAGSVAEHGGRSVQAYRGAGAGEADALLNVIVTTSAQLGWGVWRFVRHEDALALDVENSPFAAGYGAAPHPVCHAIAGMLQAVGLHVLGRAVTVTETRCAASDGGGPCHFDIVPTPTDTRIAP